MLISWVKRLESSKYTRLLVVLFLSFLVLAIALDGQITSVSRGLVLAVGMFGSALFGVAVGRPIARQFNSLSLKKSDNFIERLSAAISAFLFLFLPPIFGKVATYFGAIEIQTFHLGFHLFWACIAGVVFFYLKPDAPKT